jgi:hypothetical protein
LVKKEESLLLDTITTGTNAPEIIQDTLEHSSNVPFTLKWMPFSDFLVHSLKPKKSVNKRLVESFAQSLLLLYEEPVKELLWILNPAFIVSKPFVVSVYEKSFIQLPPENLNMSIPKTLTYNLI